ncbi:uncharacterized protein LOC6499315 isoform X1 [Drosophila ananassae]|nr:uncharacterized protein LOC6499315 isoform X1 [Drosophila ananassae]
MNTAEEEVCSNNSIGSIQSRDMVVSPSQFVTSSPETGRIRSTMESPMKVRDLVNVYNLATEKNQELEQAKSIYFGSRSEAEQLQIEGCPLSPDDKDKGGSFRTNSAEGESFLRSNGNEESSANCSVEKSYQSKTTIRRTDHGVRIIIDIFFDKKESDIDIVGSRVETDIPESRILADFQQHSLAMQKRE